MDGPFTAVACTGPVPTVSTTDTVEFVAGADHHWLRIDLAGGAFMPGFTDEKDGSSEIEFDLDGAYALYLDSVGWPRPVRVGMTGTETRANLNAGETVKDADVVATGVDRAAVSGTGGADVVDLRGGAGTGTAFDIAPHVATGGGDDTVYLGLGDHFNHVDAGDGDDVVHAGPGGSMLHGHDGNDRLVGGPGDDDFHPGEGDDTVEGGEGHDGYSFDVAGPPYPWLEGRRLDLADTEPQETDEGLDRVRGVEDVFGTLGPDVLRGDEKDNRIEGGDGSDVIAGRGGSDYLDGGGFEWWTTPNDDVLDYGGAPGPVSVTLPEYAYPGYFGSGSGAEGADRVTGFTSVIGSRFDDVLVGGGSHNRLEGRGGSDTLDGKGGYDVLVGGDADGGSDGPDRITGGAGVGDRVSYAARRFPVAVTFDGIRNDGADPNRDGVSSAGEEGDLITGVENASGGAGADRVKGFGTVYNLLDGGPGNDLLDGGGGGDVLNGESGFDTVTYAGRNDGVVIRLDGVRNDGTDSDGDGASEYGEEWDHVLGMEHAIGGDGSDTLVAGYGARATRNVLTGGAGADHLDALDGWSVSDQLVCGIGADTYRADPSDATDACEVAAP